MSSAEHKIGYRVYWSTWALLLVLTLAMLATEYFSLPKVLLLGLLLVAMIGKASLIGANFMHLRFEKWSLIAAVAVGILATGAILFVLISFDGARILRLSQP
ncbi:MAG: cytochrome C oxidase subunit IV family protein [Acidobacteria bacterium]|nr:cytochrome C oxidase subunit IV family protein [Acidobacteriota bacterium]